MSKNANTDNIDKAILSALLSASQTAVDAKLEVLKKALQDKTYTINNQKIVDGLLEHSRLDTSKKYTKKVKEEQPETV